MLNTSNVRYESGRKRSARDSRGRKRKLVRVVLVSKTPRCFSQILRHLEIQDCWYGFAPTYHEARDVMRRQGCDLLVGLAPLPQGTLAFLGNTLANCQATFFLAQPVEAGCWWLPVYLRGELCFGTPALRPNEFVRLLDPLVDEIHRAHAEPESFRQSAAALALAAG